MRNFKSLITAVVAFALLPFVADAATNSWLLLSGQANVTITESKSGNSYTSGTNGLITGVAANDDLINVGAIPLGQSSTQGVQFGVVANANPLMLVNNSNITVASVNTAGGYTFISGITGRTIYPANLTIMASGTGATSTGVRIICTSGNVLASIPVAALVTNAPFAVPSLYASTAALNGGTGLALGCASGDGIYVSNIGSNLATTTNLYITTAYTIQ